MENDMRKQIDKVKNFGKVLNENMEYPDIYQEIASATDIEYLKELNKYVDMDIANIGKESEVIRKMKSKMHGLSPEDYDKKQMTGFTDLKNKIQQKINELGG